MASPRSESHSLERLELKVGENGSWLWFDPRSPAENLILFVHGYTGDPEATWQRFPFLIRQIGQGFEGFDVASFGYESNFVLNFQSIETIAGLLLSFLEAHTPDHHNVYVIAHLLGGIVVRQFLVDTFLKTHEHKQFERIRQVHFIGVPHEGAALAPQLLDWFRRLNPLAAQLRRDSPVLLDILGRWGHVLATCKARRIKVPHICNYVGNRDWLAPMETVIGDLNEYEKVRLVDGTHIQLAKPHDPQNTLYRLVTQALLKPPQTATRQRKPARLPAHAAVVPPPRLFNNPYDFSATAATGMFKGRTEETNALLDAVASGVHVAVFGLQRIGKTSFVRHAIAMSRLHPSFGRGLRFAELNLQNLSSDYLTYRSLLQNLAKTLLATVLIGNVKPKRKAETIERVVEDYITALPTLGDLEKPKLVAGFIRCLEAVASVIDVPTVLFLDEFSELCRVIEKNEELLKRNPERSHSVPPHQMFVDVDFMHGFSSLLKSAHLKGRIVFVFAVRPFMAEYDKERDLQILKLTKPITLYHLDKLAATELMVEPLRGALTYGGGAIEALIRATAGHPYLIQFMLQDIVGQKLRYGHGEITLSDVHELEDRMISEGPAYEAVFHVLDSDHGVDAALGREGGRMGKGLLSLVARLGREEEHWRVGINTLVDRMKEMGCEMPQTIAVLDELVRAKILQETGHDDDLAFRISVPLLRKRYVKQNMYMKYFDGRRRRASAGADGLRSPDLPRS